MTDNAMVPAENINWISPVSAHIPRSIFTMSDTHIQRMKLLAEMMANASSHLNYRKINNKPATSGDLFIIMLKGAEVGLEPMAAMDLITIISGKPSLSPQGMLALINRSGELEDMKVEDDGHTCTIMMKRKGRSPHIETYSMDDADRYMTTEWENDVKKTIKLSEKHNWKSQPKVMRKWRGLAAACRVIFPDIIQGLYTPEELDPNIEVDENGEVVRMPEAVIIQQPAQNKTTDLDAARSRLNGDAAKNADGEKRVGGNETVAPKHAWATAENLKVVLKIIRDQTKADDAEIIKHAKVKNIDDLVGWGEFDSGKTAANHVIDEWKKSQQPAQPQKPAQPPAPVKTILTAENESDQVDGWVWDSFQRPSADFMEELKISAWAGKYATVEDARQAATTVAIKQKWPMVAREVEYVERGQQKYLEFKTPIPVRAYGRSSTFKTMVDNVNPHWYEMNKLADFKAGEVYPIDPVEISWESKGSGTNTYLSITAIQVLPPDEFNGGSGDQSSEGEPDPEALLDQFFGPKE